MAFPEMVESPLVPGATAELAGALDARHVAGLYKSRFNYDAAADFGDLDSIAIYRCNRTGYRFFYPFALEGKERLYRAIEDLQWTYQEDQWEHEVVLSKIGPADHVLDIGCGRGAFLAKVKESSGATVTGIELNKSAAEYTRTRGFQVVEELIGDHARQNSGKYDVVTAFQVLEHIADPMPFLRDCLVALKSGGLLVIAVPNNDGFQAYDPDDVLNQPPHHMGLWNRKSLEALTELLPITLQTIEAEPLRELDWYRAVMERRYLPKRWQRSLYHRLGGAKIFERFVRENAGSIAGHTIMAQYRKN